MINMKGKLNKFIVYEGEKILYFPTLKSIGEFYNHNENWAFRVYHKNQENAENIFIDKLLIPVE